MTSRAAEFYRAARFSQSRFGPGNHAVPGTDIRLSIRRITVPSEAFVITHRLAALCVVEGPQGKFSWNRIREAAKRGDIRHAPGRKIVHAVQADTAIQLLPVTSGDGMELSPFSLMLVFASRRDRDECFEQMTVALVLGT